jgi:hypothetical protein
MNLEELKNALLALLPDEEEKINKLITDLGTFFAEKEDLLKKNKEEFVAALEAFKKKHESIPALLDYFNAQLNEKAIKKIIKKIKDKIKGILTALQKRNAKNVLFFQQALAKIIDEELTTNLVALNTRRNPPAEKEFIFEASSRFRNQRDNSKVFDPAIVCKCIKKIENYARAGQVTRVPSESGEPHCYGSAPNHLNSVIWHRDKRLVFYMHPDEAGDIIRLCVYIDPKTHNDAVNAVQERPGNIYWLIIKHKIDRTYFEDFRRINKETLEDEE